MSIQSFVFSSKNCYRQHVWTHMQENKIARFPMPVYNRIPNYKGSDEAGYRVKELPVFQNASSVKVDPDKPLESVRFSTLEAKKNLFVPSPRLRSGLLYKIVPPLNATNSVLHRCATTQDLHHGERIDHDSNYKIDLVIAGSVAVSLKGQRIGKGEGYSDIEYALMATMGMVNSETPIITVVHDCQVFDSMPDELFKDNDMPVDIIVTPTKVIQCEMKLKKPDHIIWSLLTEQKIKEIPILQKFKSIYEKNRKDGKLNP